MKKAISQKEHEVINSTEYPGTRQICSVCNEPTGKCEADSLYDDKGIGPLCIPCFKKCEWICGVCGEVAPEFVTYEETCETCDSVVRYLYPAFSEEIKNG